ncbi:MAG: hypothetical protein GTN76_07880 [Candidatus Aenigmarchaeota archaeon]|nr:hypothetical protein [Candidatus Aenigmarchaeota archaeon]
MVKKTLLIIFIFIFIFPTNVFALGISPGGLGEYDFQPNMRVERNVCVSNSLQGYFEVEMTAEGNLTEYVTISEKRFVLGPKATPTGTKCTDVVVQLPEKLEKPGRHRLWIWAGQVVTGSDGSGGTGVGGRVRVGADLIIHLAYPGKYVEAELTVESGEVNEIVKFTIDAINRGNQTIENAQGTIDIYDQGRNKIAFVKTNSESMEHSVWTKFKAEWLASVEPGEYLANATIDYDGFSTFTSEDFRVGSPSAKILNVTSEKITNGTIGTIKTTVISYWSQKMENAYVSINVKKDGYSGGSQSASSTLYPWKKTDFVNFWDTSKAMGPGEYQGTATLYYLNGTDTMDFTLEVVEEEWSFLDFIVKNPMWIAVIILIIIFAIMAVLTLRRRRKKFIQKKLS